MNFSIFRNSRWLRAGLLFLGLTSFLHAAPPEWWSTGSPPVITGGAPENHGVANQGQAKYMAKQALAALRAKDPYTAEDVEIALVGPGKPIFSWNAPATPQESSSQYSPLLVGQLKAISAPFYQKLYRLWPVWVDSQLTENHTKDSASSSNYFPWTAATGDDANHGAATIGQLKAVFSLRFEAIGLLDTGDFDGDGIPNFEEISPAGGLASTNPLKADTDGDGMNDGFERAHGFNPNQSDENQNGILDGLEDADTDGVDNSHDLYPQDFFNGTQALLSVVSPMTVKVTDTTGNPLAGAPVKFTRLVGSGSFPGNASSVTRQTSSTGLISISDYSFSGNDVVKATLSSTRGVQSVWLPAGILDPVYGTAVGGGALSYQNPYNTPYVENNDPGGEPEIVLPIQNYLKYKWEVSLYYDGEIIESTKINSEPSSSGEGRIVRYYSSGNDVVFTTDSIFVIPNSQDFEVYYSVFDAFVYLAALGSEHYSVTIQSNIQLANLPTGYSGITVQQAVISDQAYSEVGVDSFVSFVEPAEELDLSADLTELDFGLVGTRVRGTMICGPFLSGITWDELENNDIELPANGERKFSSQIINSSYFKRNWTWNVQSDNSDIEVQFTSMFGDEGTEADFQGTNYMQDLVIRHVGSGGNDEANITLKLCDENGLAAVSKTIHVHIAVDEGQQAKVITSSMTSDEATCPKYRKIGLTGVPLPDEKPQASEETDEEKEETYVDALTRELRHSTTDVYIPVPASQLALTVRRNAASEIWSHGSGLTPNEDPTLAFGASWRSNLGANIRIIEQTDASGNLVALMNLAARKAAKVGQSDPNYAFVTDEDGSTMRFAIGYSGSPGNIQRTFVPMPTSRNEQDAYQMSLTLDANGFVFKRSFGNTLRFSSGASINFPLTSDRLTGSKQYQKYQYFRLQDVTDRFGNRLNYSYSGAQNLVPSEISVAGRPELSLKIQQNSFGRVTNVYDPNGNVTTYNYTATSASSSSALTTVSAGGKQIAAYTYRENIEGDYRIAAVGTTGISILPWDRRNPGNSYQYPVNTGHINLASITGAYGQTVSFDYNWDTDYSVFTAEATYNAEGKQDGIFRGDYTLSGIPMNVEYIHLSGGRKVNITGGGKAGYHNTTVTDAQGNQRIYQWDGIVSIPLPQESLGYAYSDSSITTAVCHIATQMTVTDSGGSEVYHFDVAAGNSLSSVRDYSGNVTTYSHGKALDGSNLPGFSWPGGLSDMKAADPTSQTDALNRITRYAYGPYRVMTTVIEPSGNRTDNTVDVLGRRTQELVKDSSGNILKQTDFVYQSSIPGSGFPNFMIRQTEKNVGVFTAGDPSWVGARTTLYEPDSNGRLKREAIDMNGNNVIDGGDLITAYTYDRSGNKLTSTAPDGLTTWFQYDNRHRLISIIYPDGTHQDTVYDKSGKKVLVKDENGHSSGFVYDNGGRLIKTVRDMNGNLSANVDAGSVGAILMGIDPGTDQIEQTAYNAIDLPVQKTDARGFVSVTQYDSLRRPIKTIAPGPSRTVGMIPDGTGDDLVTQLFYDGANSGASTFDQSGFKPTRVIDPRGYTTVNLYDVLYRTVETRTQYALSPASFARTLNVYDPVTGVLTDTYAYRDPFPQSGNPPAGQPRFNRTHTTYDKLLRPQDSYQSYGTALQSSVTTAYTSTGLVHRVTKQLSATENAVTDTQYDAAGRATIVTGPAVPVFGGGTIRPQTQTIYTPSGQKAAVIDARNYQTDFGYDARGRLVKTVSPAAYDATSHQVLRAIATTTYDAVGNPLSVTDSRGFITDTVYDAANRPTDVYSPAVVPPNGGAAQRPHSQTIYDLAGNVVQVIDPNGNVTVNTYDSLGRLATTKTNPTVAASAASHADDIVVQNSYDASGNLIQVIDGLGQVTRFTFDGLKRSTSTTWDYGSARAKTLSTEYDAAVKTATVDSRGWRTEFAYDERFRLTASTCTNHPDDNETLTYDLADRLLAINRNGSGDLRNVAYQYDAADHVTQETSTGQTTVSSYDASGNRCSVTYPLGGRQLVTSFDALNRVTEIIESKPGQPGQRSTSYQYDLAGNRLRCQQSNGVEEITAYDALSRKTSLLTRRYNSPKPVSKFGYSYDLSSNVVRIIEENAAVPSREITNIYDRTYRLTQESIAAGSKVENTNFAYDKAHNRIGRIRSTYLSGNLSTSFADTFTYGNPSNGKNSNQLVLYHDAKRNIDVSYSYDANGNRYQRLENGSPTHTYAWDSRNRLIEVTMPAGTSAYGYDYRTRRVIRNESSAGGSSDVITFSGGTSIFERPLNTSAPTVEYIRGSDWGGGIGGILYTVRSGAESHSAYNSRGDVIAKTDSNGSITWQASYEAFGTRTAETGTNLDRQRANTKEEDPTGLLNEGMRYRDLDSGLFISRDPAGFVDGPNVYTYVRQNPWTKFDPLGLLGEYGEPEPFPLIDPLSAQQRHDFQKGSERGAKHGLAIGAGAVVTGLTGGAAAPLVGAALGEGTVATGLTVAAISGAAGGATTQVGINVVDKKPVAENVPQAALSGAAFGVVAQTGANIGRAFMQGFAGEAGAGASSLAPSAQGTLQATTAEVNAVKTPLTNNQLVQEVATRAEAWGARQGIPAAGSGPVQGTVKHGYAQRLLDRYQSMYGGQGLQTEASYLNGQAVPYGTKGSVRLDVHDPSTGSVWDYKFTRTPSLPASRVQRIINNGPAGINSVDAIGP